MAEKKPPHVQRYKRTNWAIEPSAQEDPTRNPSGIYSGMTKRVAIEDGSFADVAGISKGSRKRDDA